MTDAARVKPTVVIVDDDEIILTTLKVALSRHFRVEVHPLAAQGVAAITARAPDAVVLDLRMPDHDGFWAFREIRKVHPNVPIIFSSAFQDTLPPEDLEGAYRPFAYLPKRGDLKQLVDILKKAVLEGKLIP